MIRRTSKKSRRFILRQLAPIVLVLVATVSVSAQSGKLYWSNGDALPGRLEGAKGEELQWKTSLFVDPLRLESKHLEAITFDFVEGDDKSKEPFRFVMQNGNALYGDLKMISEKEVKIESKRHGNLTVARAAIRVIQRLDNPALIYFGPNGPSGWTTLGGARTKWESTPEGHLFTKSKTAELFREIDIPGRAEIEVQLKSTNELRFLLALDNRPKSATRLETWDEDLVVLSGDNFEPVDTLDAKVRELTLRMYWDRMTGEMSIFSTSGTRLGSIKSDGPARGKFGLYLKNQGKDLTLLKIRVNRWNGEKPKEVKEGQVRIHQTDGNILYEPITEFKEGQFSIGENKVDSTKIDRLYLPKSELPELKGTMVQAIFSDGGLLTGELTEIKDSAIGLRTAYSQEPIFTKLSGARKLRFQPSGQLQNDAPDLLFCEGGILHGTLVGGGDSKAAIRWKPAGGINASPLAPDCKARFTRGKRNNEKPFDPDVYSDILFLINQDVVPCKVESIDEQFVYIRTALADAKKIPHLQVKAIEISTSGRVDSKGFKDPGWTVVKGKKPKYTDTQLSISGTSEFGHRNILTGNEIRFDLQFGSTNYSMAGLRLFVGDLKSKGRSTDLLFTFSNNQMWVGPNQANGAFFGVRQNRRNVMLKNRKASVLITFDHETLTVRINGQVAYANKLDAKRVSGSGLVLSSGMAARFGGNTTITVSNFEVLRKSGAATRQYLDRESKDTALTIPRFRKQNPPTHVLLAPNGDLLRGRLLTMSPNSIKFQSRLEQFTFSRRNVGAIIWLHPKGEPAVPEFDKNAPLIRAILRGGPVVVVNPSKMTDSSLEGTSPVLGKCSVPLGSVEQLHVGGYGQLDAQLAYADWKPTPALEPQFPNTPAADSSSAGPRVGQKAEDFELTFLDGKPFKLSDHSDKIVVLDFWASWCGPCIRALPAYIETMKGFDPKKVLFVAVNQGETPEKVNAFLKAREFELTVAMGGEKIGEQFGVGGIPHTVVIDKGNVIAWSHVGYRPGAEQELGNTVQRLLEGKKVATSSSPLVGKAAPEVKTKLLDGKPFDLQEYKGKVVVLDFWATWCGPCVKAMPAYLDAIKDFDKDQVHFIAVNQAETPAKINGFLKQRGWDLKVALDPDKKIGAGFGVDAIPHTIVIGPEGKIEWSHVGFRAGVEEELREIVLKFVKPSGKPQGPPESGKPAQETESKNKPSENSKQDAP